MKKVLVLGAGLVSRPLVRYLLDHGFQVTVASRTVSKAEKLIAGHERGRALSLNVKDLEALETLISGADLVISLLPYTHHVTVAERCIRHGKHMVTTSYVSEEMRALDGPSREAGVILLNEIGVDPGIDHMSAMRIIHRVEAGGGEVVSFKSYCGGLPAPEANTNPFGYKFSWSPRGVLMAGGNSARYLEEGEVVEVPGTELFERYFVLEIEGAGTFEVYPNRDSLGYIDTYSLPAVRTMFRGTLRNVGWCPTLKAIADLGLLDDAASPGLSGLTWEGLIRKLVGKGEDLRAALADHLRLGDDPHGVLDRFEWLGLLSRDPLPDEPTNLDRMTALTLEKMAYREGERDMLVLHHDFRARYPDKEERITSTMVDFGIPHGDSSMSRTVSLPAAIGARLILEGKIELPGVHIPVRREVYDPVLAELEKLDINCVEKVIGE